MTTTKARRTAGVKNLKVLDWGPKKKRVRDKDNRLLGEVFLLEGQRF